MRNVSPISRHRIIDLLKKASRIRPALPPVLNASSLLGGAPVEGFFNAALLPSVTAGMVEVVCRNAYYGLDARGFQIGPPVEGATRNTLLKIDIRGTTRDIVCTSPIRSLDGLEDVRFFPHNGDLFFFGVGINSTSDDVRRMPILGRARPNGDDMDITTRTVTENVRLVEKNWVFFKHRDELLIEKFPGMSEVYRIDAETLDLEYRINKPGRVLWSGTKSFPLWEGNLFLDHRRVYVIRNERTVQRYIFRFRYVPPAEGKVTISRSFSMGSDQDLVYVSDMVISPNNDAAIIAVSADDNRFDIVSVGLSDVGKMLWPKGPGQPN